MNLLNTPTKNVNVFKKILPNTPTKADIEKCVNDIPQYLVEDIKQYQSIHVQQRKLTNYQRLELMELLARFATLSQINQYFVSQYQIPISRALIQQYKHTKKWKPVIAKLREKYLIDIPQVATSHKRVRLDLRQDLIQKAMQNGDINAANRILDSQRAEVTEEKGGDSSLSVTFNQINMMSDVELNAMKKEVLDRINRKEIEVKNEAITESGQPGVDSNGSSSEARPSE
mgnify:FL=1